MSSTWIFLKVDIQQPVLCQNRIECIYYIEFDTSIFHLKKSKTHFCLEFVDNSRKVEQVKSDLIIQDGQVKSWKVLATNAFVKKKFILKNC